MLIMFIEGDQTSILSLVWLYQNILENVTKKPSWPSKLDETCFVFYDRKLASLNINKICHLCNIYKNGNKTRQNKKWMWLMVPEETSITKEPVRYNSCLKKLHAIAYHKNEPKLYGHLFICGSRQLYPIHAKTEKTHHLRRFQLIFKTPI